jgi:hypothetical protein
VLGKCKQEAPLARSLSQTSIVFAEDLAGLKSILKNCLEFTWEEYPEKKIIFFPVPIDYMVTILCHPETRVTTQVCLASCFRDK